MDLTARCASLSFLSLISFFLSFFFLSHLAFLHLSHVFSWFFPYFSFFVRATWEQLLFSQTKLEVSHTLNDEQLSGHFEVNIGLNLMSKNLLRSLSFRPKQVTRKVCTAQNDAPQPPNKCSRMNYWLSMNESTHKSTFEDPCYRRISNTSQSNRNTTRRTPVHFLCTR